MILAELSPGAGARPGVVYLVGAGPGDEGLVTLRALELLATADVVLHDDLAPPGLLSRARHDAEVRSVGKRGHRPAEKQRTQATIDAELVALAKAGRSVVRLKGGDPFLFGRGSEEAESLVRAGVAFEVVPGVTSPLAAAAYAGISLTHRDLASSVTFLTATTRDGARFDASRLRGLGGTLVVMMGLHTLRELATDLVLVAELPATTPVAVVSAGTRPDQRVVEGTLADIADRVATSELPTPALAIVGAVAHLRRELRWFDRWPLFGKRVLVTRATHQAGSTATLLARRGARAVELPTIQLAPPPDPARVVRAIAELGSYDLVAFTSENGVDRFFDVMAGAGRDARAFGAARVAAIGEGTANALSRRGIRPDLVPAEFVGEAFAEALLEDLEAHGGVRGKRVLLPRALVARDVVPRRLGEAGAMVDVVAVYQTEVASRERRAELRRRLEEKTIDLILFASSSAVQNLCELVGDDAAHLLEGVTLASIGPVTTRTATARGLQVAVTSEKSTVPSLVDAVERHLAAGI